MTGQETNMVTMWHFWMQRDPEFQKCFFWRSVQCRSAAGSSEVHAEGGGDIAQCTSGREALLRPTFDALLLRAFRGRQTSTTQWSSLFRKHSLASGPSLTQQSNRAKKLSRNDYDRNIIYIISLYIYIIQLHIYITHTYIYLNLATFGCPWQLTELWAVPGWWCSTWMIENCWSEANLGRWGPKRQKSSGPKALWTAEHPLDCS